jgi:hypothetical protein
VPHGGVRGADTDYVITSAVAGAPVDQSVREADSTQQIDLGRLVGYVLHGIWLGVSGSVWGVVAGGMVAVVLGAC